MHNPRYSFNRPMCLLTIALLTMCAAGVWAQRDDKFRTMPGMTPVRFEPSRARLSLGEPLYVKATFYNVIERISANTVLPVEISSDWNFSSDIQLMAQFESERPRRYQPTPDVPKTSLPMASTGVAPYRASHRWLVLSYDPKTISGHLLDREGTYRFSGTMRIQIEQEFHDFPIPPFEVVVSEPVESDWDIYDELAFPEYAKILQGVARPTVEQRERMEQLLAMNPESVYADHLCYSLALEFFRLENYKRALELTEEIRDDVVFVPTEIVVGVAAECLIQFERIDDAMRLLHDEWRENLSSQIWTPGSPLMDKYLYGLSASENEAPWHLFE